jgi:transposase InsO family protein
MPTPVQPGANHSTTPASSVTRVWPSAAAAQARRWLHLATVIDLCSRMVVGWAMSDHISTSLVTDGLEMARLHGHLRPVKIFDSDRGCQYPRLNSPTTAGRMAFSAVSGGPVFARTMPPRNHSSQH